MMERLVTPDPTALREALHAEHKPGAPWNNCVPCSRTADALLASGVVSPLADAVRDAQSRFAIAAELVVQDMRAQRGDYFADLVEESFRAHFDRAAALARPTDDGTTGGGDVLGRVAALADEWERKARTVDRRHNADYAINWLGASRQLRAALANATDDGTN